MDEKYKKYVIVDNQKHYLLPKYNDNVTKVTKFNDMLERVITEENYSMFKELPGFEVDNQSNQMEAKQNVKAQTEEIKYS